MKYVYLIKSMEEGYYKIGISSNVGRRINELQTGNSAELKLIDTYQSEHANMIEKYLHKHFTYTNKVGEWFDLDIVEIASFRNTCKKIEENITFLKKSGNVFI